jgi:hypothetical protein
MLHVTGLLFGHDVAKFYRGSIPTLAVLLGAEARRGGI